MIERGIGRVSPKRRWKFGLGDATKRGSSYLGEHEAAQQRVVPLSVEGVGPEMEGLHVGVGHRPAGGVVVLIDRAADVQRDQSELGWQAAGQPRGDRKAHRRDDDPDRSSSSGRATR